MYKLVQVAVSFIQISVLQVCFDIVWRCVPVPEKAFRDAIGENYFSPHKFNFGLSRDQVFSLPLALSTVCLSVNLCLVLIIHTHIQKILRLDKHLSPI